MLHSSRVAVGLCRNNFPQVVGFLRMREVLISTETTISKAFFLQWGTHLQYTSSWNNMFFLIANIMFWGRYSYSSTVSAVFEMTMQCRLLDTNQLIENVSPWDAQVSTNYSHVLMSAMASQITGASIVYSNDDVTMKGTERICRSVATSINMI